MGRFGDGIATGSDLLLAGRTAVADALAPLGGRPPDLLALFISGGAPDDMAEVALACTAPAGAGTSLGCTAAGVMGAGQGVESAGAVSAFAAVLPAAVLRPFHLEVMPVEGGTAVIGLPPALEEPGGDEVLLLLADPYSFPVSGFVGQAATSLPGLPVVGGMADAPAGAGSSRLWVDGRVAQRGAVGLLLAGAAARPLVSQGCRPVGPAMTVTAAGGNVLRSLAGQPAVEKVRSVLADLPPAEQALASAGLQMGIAVDEYAEDHEFLVRVVLGTEPAGGIVLSDRVEVGQTVRVQVRDAEAAAGDLRSALARCAGLPGGGALVFSCTGRGAAMFGAAHGGASHDVRAVRTGLAADAVAGVFTGGELGPVAGRSHLHSFSASVLVLP